MTMKTPALDEPGLPTLRVAMCQIATREWAVAENLAATLAALDEAAAQGAELAITPECVLHGYGFWDPQHQVNGRPFDDVMREAAEPIDGPRLAQVCARVRHHGTMDVVFGFAEREGDRIHNTAVLIGRDGTIRNVYRKVHCRDFESTEHTGHFTPGDHFEALELSQGEGSAARTFKLGTMICFDREIPETVRSLRAAGAEIIACPLATDTADLRAPLVSTEEMNNELITRVRAAENEVFIVVVNHAVRFNGGSFAVGPGGQLLHQMGPEAGVVVLDLPVGVVSARFHNRPLGWMGWGFRRPQIYDRYLSTVPRK